MFIKYRTSAGNRLAAVNSDQIIELFVMNSLLTKDAWDLVALRMEIPGSDPRIYIATYTTQEAAEWGLDEILSFMKVQAKYVNEDAYDQAAYDECHPVKK